MRHGELTTDASNSSLEVLLLRQLQQVRKRAAYIPGRKRALRNLVAHGVPRGRTCEGTLTMWARFHSLLGPT